MYWGRSGRSASIPQWSRTSLRRATGSEKALRCNKKNGSRRSTSVAAAPTGAYSPPLKRRAFEQWGHGLTKRIYVAPGRYALVDDDDAGRVATLDWFPVNGGRTLYARTGSSRIGKSQQLMHRLVMRAAVGTIVDHINGDGLDNRKENLRFVSAAENAQNRFDHGRFDCHLTGDAVQLSPFQRPRDPDAHPLSLSARRRRLNRIHRSAKRQAELAAYK